MITASLSSKRAVMMMHLQKVTRKFLKLCQGPQAGLNDGKKKGKSRAMWRNGGNSCASEKQKLWKEWRLIKPNVN